MKKLMASISAGAWVTVAVALLVGGQWVWRPAHQPRHLDAIAEESGDLNFMLENEQPQISHDGSQLLFCDSTENGVGVFVCDIPHSNGAHGVTRPTKKLLFEEQEIHFGMGPHGVLAPFPWSPDDRRFVYAHQAPGALNEEHALPEETALTIGRADTDEADTNLIAPFGRVVALVWLTANAFVYVDGTEAHDFMLVQRNQSGQWQPTRLNTPAVVAPPKMDKHFCALAAISSNTVLWLQANTLWRMRLNLNDTNGQDARATTAVKLCELPTDKFFTSFDYSPATRQLLLSAIGSKEDSLWQMPLSEPGALAKIATDIRTHDRLWSDARWIDSGQGYAFIRKPGLQTSGLVVKAANSPKQTVLFPNNYIQYFIPEPDEQKLIVVGDIEDRPGSAIWECDLGGSARRRVVAGSDQPLKYLHHLPIHCEIIRISAHEHLEVVVFPPMNLKTNSNRTYPVVIGSIRFVVEDPYLYQYPEAIANAGAWFVMIDHDWSPRSLGSWAWHIGNLAEFMAQSPKQFPNVDRRRLFVLSNSAQSLGLPAVFTNHPGLFRGAILQAPGGDLYAPAQWAAWSRPPAKMLVTAESHYPSAGYLERYQAAAVGAGMEMDWIIHPDTPHEFIAKKSQRARIQAMLHFIFDE